MKKTILPSEIMIAFAPSHYLWGWIGLFSTLVVLSLLKGLPMPMAAVLLLLYLLSLCWQYTRLLGSQWPYSIQSLRVDVYGQLTLQTLSGQSWRASVMPDSLVHPYAMVIHVSYLQALVDEEPSWLQQTCFQQTWFQQIWFQQIWFQQIWQHKTLRRINVWLMPQRLLILPDQADAESLRALRVWLTWGIRD